MNHLNKREPSHATKTNTREPSMGKYSCVSHAYQNMDRCRNFGPLRTKKLEFLTHFDHINRLDYVEIPNLSDFFAKEDTRQF